MNRMTLSYCLNHWDVYGVLHSCLLVTAKSLLIQRTRSRSVHFSWSDSSKNVICIALVNSPWMLWVEQWNWLCRIKGGRKGERASCYTWILFYDLYHTGEYQGIDAIRPAFWTKSFADQETEATTLTSAIDAIAVFSTAKKKWSKHRHRNHVQSCKVIVPNRR